MVTPYEGCNIARAERSRDGVPVVAARREIQGMPEDWWMSPL